MIKFLYHHWELALAFLIIATYWLIIELMALMREGGISATQAVHFMNHENGLLIDLRSRDDYQKGHILRARLFDRQTLLTDLEKIKISRQKPIILVDAHGNQASKYVGPLRQAGFTRAFYLKNGMQAWFRAHLPLHKDSSNDPNC